MQETLLPFADLCLIPIGNGSLHFAKVLFLIGWCPLYLLPMLCSCCLPMFTYSELFSCLLQMADLLLPNLLAGNCSDRVCVRVSRYWDFYDTNNKTKLLHADMVLIDEEVCSSNLLLNIPFQSLLSVVNQYLWNSYFFPNRIIASMLRSTLQLMNCSGPASRKEVSTPSPTFGSKPPTSTTSQ